VHACDEVEFSWTRSYPLDQTAGIDQVYGTTIVHTCKDPCLSIDYEAGWAAEGV